MQCAQRVFLAFCGCLLLISAAAAQDRSLYWDSLTVHAVLDAEGALHITERHAMVFDGAWNGGERTFQVRPWQRVELESLVAFDPEAGAATPFVPGDLDNIGEYRLTDGNVLRWRNRMPDDPPFAAARKMYELRYVIFGALVPQEDGYLLDHDLAFPDRPAQIRSFDATLEIDLSWQPATALETSFHRENLPPGQGVFVTAQLHYVGAGTPSAVADIAAMPSATAVPALRYALLFVAILFAMWHARTLVDRDRRNGRFAPAVPLEQIDEAWLQANVFKRAPEEVGAAWDLDTSASEVAALLARLALEGKIKSEVRAESVAFLTRETLHMELLCERTELNKHERALIDALFIGGARTTNTSVIRQHYRKSGLNPSSLIEGPIKKRLPAIYANRIPVPARAKWLTAGLLAIGAVLLVAGGLSAPDTIPIALIAAAALLVCYVVSAIFAYVYRNNVLDLNKRLARALACIALLLGVLATALASGRLALFPLQFVGLAVIALGFINSAFNAMRSRDSAQALQIRQMLASARKYFEHELGKENPRLKDEWFPYLLAFGLGPMIDRWFKAFGAESSHRFGTRSPGTGAGSGHTSSTSTSTWTGGGGTFGGAGASGSWASAVGGIASGVTAASSSSGGSSGGGSSSSGGGGGGGW